MPTRKKSIIPYNYNRRTAASRLDRSTQTAINKDLSRIGLDGNGRFRKPGEALGVASKVLGSYGIEFLDPFTQVFNSEGRSAAHLVKDGDVITNTMFAYQWTEIAPGRYEVTAYLS